MSRQRYVFDLSTGELLSAPPDHPDDSSLEVSDEADEDTKFTATFTPPSDGLRAVARYDGEQIYRQQGNPEKLLGEQRSREFGNGLKNDETLSAAGIPGDRAKRNYLRATRAFSEAREQGGVARAFRDETQNAVQTLLDATESVGYFQSEESEYTVAFEARNEITGEVREASLAFTPDEWVHGAPTKLETFMGNIYSTKLEVTDEAWDEVWTVWHSDATRTGSEPLNAGERAVKQVVNGLRQSLTPTHEKADFQNSPLTAWFDPGTSNPATDGSGGTGLPDRDILWVHASAVADLLEDTAKDADTWFPQCSKLLQGPEHQYTYGGTSEVIDEVSAFPFKPERMLEDEMLEMLRDEAAAAGGDDERPDDPDGEAGEHDADADDEQDGETTDENDVDRGRGPVTDGGRDLPEQAAHVEKVLGSPGAGKTHYLFSLVRDEEHHGTDLENLLYTTFTRAARAEAHEKLRDVYPYADSEDVTKHARTLHSTALADCFRAGVLEEYAQVITPTQDADVYESFARSHGLGYTGGKTDPESLADEDPEKSVAEHIFGASGWLTSAHKEPTLRNYLKTPAAVRPALPPVRAVELIKSWQEYKRSGGPRDHDRPLFEHDDYVWEAIERDLAPDVDVMFIDEFQDLSPLQYRLYETWRDSGRIKRMHIAGDVNQAVYGFRGAKAKFLAETAADETTTLSETRRCPPPVVGVGRWLLDSCASTDSAGFSVAEDREGSDGRVVVETLDTDAALASALEQAVADHPADGKTGASTFMLARTNREVDSVAATLKRQGVPYTRLGRDPDRQVWSDDLTRTYRALVALRAGEYIPEQGIGALLEALPQSKVQQAKMTLADGRVVGPANARESFLGSIRGVETVGDLAGALTGFDSWRRTPLMNALANPDAPADPEALQIGTIHAAKGLEAPCVFLSASYGSGLHERYNRDEDGTRAAEHRLYYVGATRASESLHIVSGVGTRKKFPPFRGGVPRDVVGASEVET